MHVAVGDACALSAPVSHVSNLLCRHHHTLPVCVRCELGHRCRVCGYSQTGLPMMLSLSSFAYGTQIR